MNNARHIALPQSMLPALTAVALAARSDGFSWYVAVIAIAGTAFAHLGLNLADDWYDYKIHSGEMRVKHASEGIRARIVKYPYLTSGEATPNQLLAVTAVFLSVALACGVAVALLRGWPVLWFVLIGGVVGLSYSGAPLRLGFRGLGELVIFFMFGPLLMTGMYYACTGTISNEIIWISNAVGLLVTNIVYSHSVMDAAHDIKAGKRTMAHLMKTDRGQLLFSAFLNVTPYIMIIVGVALGHIRWGFLTVFAVMPVSLWIVKSIGDFLAGRDIVIKPEKWMGPMGDFEKYRKAGIGWFMLRWLTARNTVMFFCLILIIVSIMQNPVL